MHEFQWLQHRLKWFQCVGSGIVAVHRPGACGLQESWHSFSVVVAIGLIRLLHGAGIS